VNKIQNISREHWLFQARLNQPYCDCKRRELYFTGSPFPQDEQDAWWLSYDAACLVDQELAAADNLLRDHKLNQLAAGGVAGIKSPETFALHVPTEGWYPVNASLHISDIKSVVERFGGAKLYGEKPSLALRELLQNARDAVFASRVIGGLDGKEGSIEVKLEERDGEDWLHITDNGIGMSRYVLTEVLLDFGRSLWRDPSLSGEWPGLAASGFDAIGRFGIGFFAVFMLGDHVKVVTRRYDPHPDDERSQWLLEFPNGLALRSTLRPPLESEKLRHNGTRVSVRLKDKSSLLRITHSWFNIFSGVERQDAFLTLRQIVSSLAPALEVDVWVQEGYGPKEKTISAGDWCLLDPEGLMERLVPTPLNFFSSEESSSILYKMRVNWIKAAAAQIEPLTDEGGKIWGRCAAGHDRGLHFFGYHSGVITVGGIVGGSISDFHGILIGEQLDRLDRTVAIPTVPVKILKSWADGQVALMKQNANLTLASSRILLSLGACSENLLIGTYDQEPMTTKAFRDLVSRVDELWLAEDRSADYSSEDNVLKSEFESHLQLNSKVFFFNNGVAHNEFITESDWPGRLFTDVPRYSIGVVEQVLNETWGDGQSEKSDDMIIGTVLGTPIKTQLSELVIS